MRLACRRLAAAALLLAVAAAPAAASTLPPVSVEPGRGVVSVGLFDASLDFGLVPHVTAGFSYTAVPGAPVVAARATTALGHGPFGLELGATFSAGASGTATARGTGGYHFWVQPALNLAVPVGGGATFHATVGPVSPFRDGSLQPPAAWHDWVWPNMALVVPVDGTSAMTLGGNSLFGWQGVF